MMTPTRAATASRNAKPAESNGEAPAAPTTKLVQAPAPLPPFVVAALDQLKPNAGKVLRTAWEMAAERGGDPVDARVTVADVARRMGTKTENLGYYKAKLKRLNPALWPWPPGSPGGKFPRKVADLAPAPARPSWDAEPAAMTAVGEIVLRLPRAMAERVLAWAMERVREGG